MAAEFVDDDDVAGTQFWNKRLSDVGLEGRAVYRPVEHHSRYYIWINVEKDPREGRSASEWDPSAEGVLVGSRRWRRSCLRCSWWQRSGRSVGCIPNDFDDPRLASLAQPATTKHLPRAEFIARLASLHFVFLPLQETYYNYSASGALIDALTWLKPVITSRVPLTEQFFAEYGDIGTLCDDEAGLEAALEDILRAMDAERYARQVSALYAARETRQVAVLAARYRRSVLDGFPGLLP